MRAAFWQRKIFQCLFWHQAGGGGALRPKIQSLVIGKGDQSVDRVSRGRRGRKAILHPRLWLAHCILRELRISCQDNFKGALRKRQVEARMSIHDNKYTGRTKADVAILYLKITIEKLCCISSISRTSLLKVT